MDVSINPSLKINKIAFKEPDKRQVDLFKAIFDFHEDYRAEKLISLLDIFHEMIFLIGSNGNILFVNACGRENLSIGDFSNLSLQQFLYFDNSQLEKTFHDEKSNKAFLSFESFLKNQSKTPVKCDISYFRLTSGPLISFWIIKDITDYKRIETSLKIADQKYLKILHETNDAVLIITNDGKIIEINISGKAMMQLENFDPLSISLFDYLEENSLMIIKNTIKKRGKLANYSMSIRVKNENSFPSVLLNLNPLPGTDDFILFMKDVTYEKIFNQEMTRAIVDAQEKERVRFARDIHDDLGQQLSAFKFHISAFRSYVNNDKAREILIESENILIELMANVRSICFDLMPKTLEKSDLIEAIQDLMQKAEAMNHVDIILDVQDDFPVLKKELNLSVYRIIQEFINNAIRHGKAQTIKISLSFLKGQIHLLLLDNGKGFEMKNPEFKRGNGLDNIETRVQVYDGSVMFNSHPGMGTTCDIRIPIKNLK